MPARNWKARLQDITEAIAKIDRYTRGMTADAFRADEKTIDGASRGRIFTLDVVELVRFDAARAERGPIPEPRYRPAIHQLS